MRINSVNHQSFKGLWEAKDRDFNFAGLGNVWDISYIYHPFKDEDIEGKEESLKSQIPETFIYQPNPELLRTMYCTKFNLGDKLEITQDEFLSDKENIIKSLPKNFAESTEELPAEKLFNLDDSMEELLADAAATAARLEKEDPGCGKRLYEKLMKSD